MLISSWSHRQLNGLRAGRAVFDLEEENALAEVLVASLIGGIAHWWQVSSLFIAIIAVFALNIFFVISGGHLRVSSSLGLSPHVIVASLLISSSLLVASPWRICTSLARIMNSLIFFVIAIVGIMLLICLWARDELHIVI